MFPVKRVGPDGCEDFPEYILLVWGGGGKQTGLLPFVFQIGLLTSTVVEDHINGQRANAKQLICMCSFVLELFQDYRTGTAMAARLGGCSGCGA